VVNPAPAEFQKFVEEEVKKWGAVIRENNIVIE
jgi:tripartite-type tricarboxylate transporter receptor subunit TctC